MILFGFSTSFPLTADEQVACFFNYELSFRVWVLVHCLDGFSAVFSPHRLHMDLGDFCLNLYLLLPGCWMDLMLLSCDICASTPHVRSRPVNAAKKDTRGGDCIGW